MGDVYNRVTAVLTDTTAEEKVLLEHLGKTQFVAQAYDSNDAALTGLTGTITIELRAVGNPSGDALTDLSIDLSSPSVVNTTAFLESCELTLSALPSGAQRVEVTIMQSGL